MHLRMALLVAAFVFSASAIAEDLGIVEPGQSPVLLQEEGAGEGPVWHPELGLLTSGGGHIYQRDRNGRVTVFRQGAGTNGLMFDGEGRLVMCEPVRRCVSRLEKDGTLTMLAERYAGKRFNQPNDLAQDSRGRIYFSDPRYGDRRDMELVDEAGQKVEGVYRIDSDGRVTRILTHEVDRPNGLAVTADDKFLFVADNNNDTVGGARKLWRFDLRADGSVDVTTQTLIYDWKSTRGADGMKFDAAGRLYVAAGLNRSNPPFETQDQATAGVYVFSPAGELLQQIPIPRDETTNCAFGGDDLKTLYVTAGGSLWSIRLTTPGRVPGRTYRSHPPMRPLPVAYKASLAAGQKLFVDATAGSDGNSGEEQAPWKTLAYAQRQLRPGDTLYLRAGTYYEKVFLTRSGTPDAPITIAAYPGEQAIIDGGLREFLEDPQNCWEPCADGAEGEFVSRKTFHAADDRRVPQQFLPAAWEPMWGIEHERPLALGHFADSMVPLHGYRIPVDLRATNELWLGGKNEMRDSGIYCGPGLWFNRETGRIHIRLAHHRLAGLEGRAYRGETDPRKLPLIIAVGFGPEVLRVSGVRHVTLQGLTLRGATGSPLINIYGSDSIELDHLTVFGGFPALLVDASKNIRVTHSAFRGLAGPWTSRAHMKYRGTASYQVILHDHQPVNENIEFAWCEFTDDHDCAFLRYVKNLQFHHNLVDNFNDDGLECGPKLGWHTLFIHHNRLGSCLIPLTQHEIAPDESPLEHEEGTGVCLYRNVIDLRGGTYKAPPKEADSSGSFLHQEGHLVGDHGGPMWPVMRFYHNTVLRSTPVFRDYFLFGMGAQGLRNTERDVFNNVFVQMGRIPGVQFTGMKQAERLREGGNLIWGISDGPSFQGNPFAKFRSSPLFAESKKHIEPGWTTLDRFADPKFVRLSNDQSLAPDLQLQASSPALNSGQPLPADWPDPLRDKDEGGPDIGALPRGVEPWSVGIDGRLSLFTGHERDARSTGP